MRRGEYGYDAPYAVATFGVVALANGVGAGLCWREGEARLASKPA